MNTRFLTASVPRNAHISLSGFGRKKLAIIEVMTMRRFDLFSLIACIILTLGSSAAWATPTYNSGNDHYYEVVNASVTFDSAVTAAASRSYV